MAEAPVVESVEPQQTPVAPVETPEPTLEDIYKTVEPDTPTPAPQRAQAPQPAPQPTQQPVPDPYDTETFKAYLAQQAQGQTQLRETLQHVSGFLTNMHLKEAKAKLESDISKAVSTVNEVVNHPKPKVIEALLDAKAREDVRFKALWEKRDANPTAWNNALKAVAKEFSEELTVKVDPKLVEAQRARKQSQRQMATPQQAESANEKWDGLSQGEFDQEWQRLISGGAN